MQQLRRRSSLGGLAMAGIVLGIFLWLSAPASAACSSFHGDPLPGYTGPLSYGISCSYTTGPVESWTVPPGIDEAEFTLYGADDPAIGKKGGRVEATLPVAPDQTFTLESGGNGAASSVSLDGVPALIAGGANGNEPNYAGPSASGVEVEAPGAPITGYPQNGSIYVEWQVGRDEDPTVGPDPVPCRVPRLKGRHLVGARNALDHGNCRLGKVTCKRGPWTRRGRVAAQQPKPGTLLPEHGTVHLIVGKGP